MIMQYVLVIGCLKNKVIFLPVFNLILLFSADGQQQCAGEDFFYFLFFIFYYYYYFLYYLRYMLHDLHLYLLLTQYLHYINLHYIRYILQYHNTSQMEL